MQSLDILTEDSYLIIPSNIKKKVVLYLNNKDNLINTKIITIDELKRKLLFDYDDKTLYYLIKNYNLSYSNALELINNMYYLFEGNYNNKLNNLLNIKNDLFKKNIIWDDKYFKNDILNKNVFVYGFDLIDSFSKKIISSLNNVTYINKSINNYEHKIYNFKTISDEIEYVCNDILSNKLDLNHVFIANNNNDYLETIRRVFNSYNIKINISDNSSLYDTKIGLDLINNLDDIDNYINGIRDNKIKDLVIDIINNYYWIDNKLEVKELIINDLKKAKINNNIYNNAVNEIELFDNNINDDDYVYLIGFNREYIPKVYKDDDYISDNEKMDYIDSSVVKNNNEFKKWTMVIKNIKNLFISYADQNLNGSIYPSALILNNNYEVIRMNYNYSEYSNKSNKYNLGILLDDYLKYGSNNDNISNLLTSYKDINYLKYSNKYQKIDMLPIDLRLSYSRMNTYYECSFKYYCDNVLKLRGYEETYDTYLGSLCHYILSKMYEDDFDFDKAKDEYNLESKFVPSLENTVFINKILDELKIAINYINKHYNDTLYKDIETERNIEVKLGNVSFIGIIDKIMKYQDKITLVDYKTGNTAIDIKLAKYGLNLQLPTYIWLIKSLYRDSKVTGIYLQHLVKPNINDEFGVSSLDQYENYLKYTGYSLGNEDLIREFDPTYENSIYIKGMKMGTNGFYKYSKVLSDEEFDNLIKLTNDKINECIMGIKDGKFDINPKVYANKNIGCEFCPYKSICFVSEKDYMVLGGDDND